MLVEGGERAQVTEDLVAHSPGIDHHVVVGKIDELSAKQRDHRRAASNRARARATARSSGDDPAWRRRVPVSALRRARW